MKAYLLIALIVIILPLAYLGFQALLDLLRAKTKESKTLSSNAIAQACIQRAIDIVDQAVEREAQAVVSKLKGTPEWTDSAKIQAFQEAKNIILKLLTDEDKKRLSELTGDFDSWIDTKIEQSCLWLPKTNAKK